MLKVLDIYIIKKYLGTFFFTMILISMVAIVIDFSERVEKILATPGHLVFEYYVNFIPWINGLLWPLFALISVVFFTSRLAKDSEIIPMLGSGMSYNRLLVPYVISASILATLLWIGNNYIIPKASKIKHEIESEHIKYGRVRTLSNNLHFFTSPDSKVFIRYYKSRDTSAQSVRFENYSEGRLVSILKARRMKIKEEPNVWTLEDFESRRFNGLKESFLISKGEKVDTVLNFTPADFLRYSNQMQMMTTEELKAFIDSEGKRGLEPSKAYVIELYRRTADPFTIIILTIIGVAIASRKVRGGFGLHLAMGVTIGAAYVVTSRFSTTFSSNHALSPLLGIWIPNIIFGLIALYLVKKAQK